MSDLMISGLELAALGMGTVFIFLIALVVATGWMSRIVLAMTPVPVPPPASAASASALAGSDGRLIAVISAAVARFREDHER